eukprot:CAMPEP_0172558944 /NCGR_PEP_ID=MMETSP1067-20121228/81799_1 /TAXON_ID=265564 ORGANISM="Thalassiosira punctigera, Strain Tpunct2005C2" /NCGR_SAMPLE_ID=MMETSP1067 /ASSEMBLY_ACC=CAM_ASM_000444 /LENGTH=35 /DNA_ID= /DNA_START= /DNA_END= /DNA_ORIENTATION=
MTMESMKSHMRSSRATASACLALFCTRGSDCATGW